MNFTIEPLVTLHDREDFDCGESSLNDYLKLYARQNDSRGLGKTFVATLPDDKKVVGYYTLSSGAVHFEKVPDKLPRYPVPVVHLGRLAVDKTTIGHGLGGLLLIDALSRTVRLSDQLGIYAVEIYALNENARSFYQRFGFSELADDEFHLYLSMKKIRKLGLD